MVAAHNLGPEPVSVSFPMDPDDLVGDAVWLQGLCEPVAVEPGPGGEVDLQLDGYGFRWLRVRHDARPPVR